MTTVDPTRPRRPRTTAHDSVGTCERCRRLAHRNSTFVRPSAATHRAHVSAAQQV